MCVALQSASRTLLKITGRTPPVFSSVLVEGVRAEMVDRFRALVGKHPANTRGGVVVFAVNNRNEVPAPESSSDLILGLIHMATEPIAAGFVGGKAVGADQEADVAAINVGLLQRSGNNLDGGPGNLSKQRMRWLNVEMAAPFVPNRGA